MSAAERGKEGADSFMRYDNLREYKREMGITAKLRKRPKVKRTPEQMEPCARCPLLRYEHEKTNGLIPDHDFVERKGR